MFPDKVLAKSDRQLGFKFVSVLRTYFANQYCCKSTAEVSENSYCGATFKITSEDLVGSR